MMISLLMITSFSIFARNTDSTNTDSVYQKKLHQFIDEYNFLDSAYPSALKELKLSDSALTVQAGTILDLTEIKSRNEQTIAALKQQIISLNNTGLPWYAYAGGSGLILIIGILTGLLIQ